MGVLRAEDLNAAGVTSIISSMLSYRGHPWPGPRRKGSPLVAQHLPIPRLPAWSTLLPLGTFVENAADLAEEGLRLSRREAEPASWAVYGRGFAVTRFPLPCIRRRT
jgi:hypothetical protein